MAGSVENAPSGPTSAPSGSFLPPWLATITLPSATTEVAKSRIVGSLPSRGMPTAKGAVESRRSRAPKGATRIEPEAVTKWMETRPCAAAISAHSPMRPIWPASRSATAERPVSRAFATPIRTASGATVWP